MPVTENISLSGSIAVNDSNTAITLGSGTLPVFATPAMILLMESTCMACVSPHLDEGQATVGTLVNISHLSATPVGMTVKCDCSVSKVEGRKITFSCRAYDDAGLIGEGTHERFIIDSKKFMEKANSK